MQSESRKNYWETVRQCLRQLHGFTLAKAANSVRAYKGEIERRQIENAVYHDEPYEIACEIAGVDCDYGTQWADYERIRVEYFPVNRNVVSLTGSRRSTSATRKPSSQSGTRQRVSSSLAATGTERKRRTRAGASYSGPAKKTAAKRARTKTSSAKKASAKKSTGRKSTVRKASVKRGR